VIYERQWLTWILNRLFLSILCSFILFNLLYTWRCILHDGRPYILVPNRYFSLLGAVPLVIPKYEILGLNFGHLTANISKTVSRSVTCQLELTSARRGLSKSHGAVAPPPRECTPRMVGLCLATDALVINLLSLFLTITINVARLWAPW